jgi:hypothetical protein
VKTWLEGTLFTGLLIECMMRATELLSPWGYAMTTPSQPIP